MEGAGTMLAVAVGPHSQHGIILALLTATEEDDDGMNNIYMTVMYYVVAYFKVQCTCYDVYTCMVEPSIVVTLRKGHCINNFSTKDTT